MKIIIAGAGRVGTHLAKLFAREKHNIAVIDSDADRLTVLTSNYDLMGVTMSPTSIKRLREIGVDGCDLFIGVTPDENLNINSCMIASKLGAKRTVARIDSLEFQDKQSEEYFKSIGINSMFIPEMVAAKEIVASVKRSWTRMWWEPDGGDLALIGVKIRQGCSILNIPLKDLPTRQPPYHIVAIKREGETIIPHGMDCLKPLDLAYFMTDKKNQSYIQHICDKDSYKEVHDVIIMGGGTTAVYTADLLPDNINVKIVEKDLRRCNEINALLKKKKNRLVIHGDGRDLSLMQEENLSDTDAFIALTPNSEINIISCLTARKNGVKKTVAILDNLNFLSMAESLDIGTLINKQAISASKIYHMLQKADINNVKSLMVANADVAEFTAAPGSRITKKLIKDQRIPLTANLGGLIRNGKSMPINGMTQVLPGDKVVAVYIDNDLKPLAALFS